MMRGMREPDKAGRVWVVCPCCGHRLAIVAKSGELHWTRPEWRDDPDHPGVVRWARKMRSQAVGTGEVGVWRHPAATVAICPGKAGSGCGEEVDLH